MEKLKKALFNENIEEENKDLKCVICNQFLSVPPIMYNESFGNVCGRWKCSTLSNTKGKNYKQAAYESVAKYLKFPCMNRENGCEVELKWGEVLKHEETCTYKHLTCPLSRIAYLLIDEENCDWAGDSSEFLHHVQEKHRERTFLNRLELDFQRNYSHYMQTGEIFFTKIQEDIVVVLFHMNDDKTALFCKVWAGFTSGFSIFKNLQYQIKILDENEHSVALRKQNVELLTPNFLNKKYSNAMRIDFDCMKNFLDNPMSIIIQFECNGIQFDIPKESKVLLNNPQGDYISVNLREAKCDNCTMELVPPVFMCSVAHNICSACKEIDTCPKCSSALAKSRNIAYEKLKFLIDQPCKNYTIGCLYRGPYPDIHEHEEICHLNPKKCILGCPREVHNLLQHLKLDHPLSVSALDVLYNLNLLKLHVFLYDDQIFVFNKKLVTDVGFSFSVQCLGTKGVRYKYELHLINNKFIHSEIMVSHVCHPELFDFKKHETNEIKGLTNLILIPHKVLEQIFPDLRSMQFKLTISKVESSDRSK